MDTLLDAEVESVFHKGLDVARSRARVEAANTGGIVLEVLAAEVRGLALTLVGAVPSEACERRSSCEGRPKVGAFGLGRMHTTWLALMGPETPIGFLVLQQPVTLVAGRVSDESRALVAIELKRRVTSLPPGFTLGPRCCATCNEAISDQRLLALPHTRTCTGCQGRKERR